MMNDFDAGRLRRLQTTANNAGVFQVLAVDHRRVLLKMMDPNGNVPPERVTRLKLEIAQRIGLYATAVILDQQFSLIQAITGRIVPGNVGLLVSLEGQERNDSSLLAMQVQRACRVGASGVKLYLSYDHIPGELRDAQESMVRGVVDICLREGMPLFLEPVLSKTDVVAAQDAVTLTRRRRDIMMVMVQRLGALGPDVLKVQFPVDVRFEADESVWASACEELDDASPVPWALLSAGEPFDTFKTQLQIACESGSSGFMAGRTVWSEAVNSPDENRPGILTNVILPRFHELAAIAARYARGWHSRTATK